jgi:hypothetical protein
MTQSNPGQLDKRGVIVLQWRPMSEMGDQAMFRTDRTIPATLAQPATILSCCP